MYGVIQTNTHTCKLIMEKRIGLVVAVVVVRVMAKSNVKSNLGLTSLSLRGNFTAVVSAV